MIIVTGSNSIEVSPTLHKYVISWTDLIKLPKAVAQEIIEKEVMLPVGLDHRDIKKSGATWGTPLGAPNVKTGVVQGMNLNQEANTLQLLKIGKVGSVIKQDCILEKLHGGGKIFKPAGSTLTEPNCYSWATEYFPCNQIVSLNFVKHPNASGYATWWCEKAYDPNFPGAISKGCLRSKEEGWTFYSDIVSSTNISSSNIFAMKALGGLKVGSATVLINNQTKKWKLAAVGPIRLLNWSHDGIVTKDGFGDFLFGEEPAPWFQNKKKTLTEVAVYTGYDMYSAPTPLTEAVSPASSAEDATDYLFEPDLAELDGDM